MAKEARRNGHAIRNSETSSARIGRTRPRFDRSSGGRTLRRMMGYVTTRDLLLHPALIIDSFGVRVYLRCWGKIVRNRGRVTFLECVAGRRSKD